MSWSIIFFHFLADFFGAFFKPLGPILAQQLNISTGNFATLLGIAGGIAALTQIFWGLLSDRCRKEGILVTIIIIFEIIAISTIGLIHSFYTLAILIFIVRLANSAFHPVGASIAGHERKSYKLATFSIMGGLGAGIAPAFITWYVRQFGIEKIWLISIAGILATIFISIPLWKLSKDTVSQMIIPHISMWTLLSGVFIIVSMRTFIMEVFHTYLPFYVQMKGGSVLLGGITLTLGMLLGMVTNYIGAYIRDKEGIRFVNTLAFLGMAIFSLIFYITDSAIIRTAAFVLFDASAFLSMSANLIEAQFLLPTNRGFAGGVAMGFSWATGQFLASGYASIFGDNVSFMILSMIIISFLMIPLALAINRYQKVRG